MADEPKKNEGTFYCKCLWTGTLSFTPEEMEGLEGEMRRYMGPCPECGANSLQLAQDPLEGHVPGAAIDDLFDEMEGAVDGGPLDGEGERLRQRFLENGKTKEDLDV